MLPYWLLFAMFAAVAIAVRDPARGPSRSRPMLFLAAILMTGFIGLRYEVGPDWEAYLEMYKGASRLSLGDALTHDDPGFYFLMWVGRKLQLEIWALNLACAAIFTSGLVAFAKRQPHPWLAVTVAVPYLVIVMAMSATRQATAIGFVLLGLAAFADKALYRLMFWVMCASLFHASALLMVVIVGLSYTRNRFQSLLLLCIAAIPAYFILWASIEVYIIRYGNEAIQSDGTIYRVLMNFFPAVYLLFNLSKFTTEHHEQVLWRNIAIFSIICVPLMMVVPSSTALDRASLYAIPLQIYTLSRIPNIMSSNSKYYLINVLSLIGLLALVLFVYLFFSTHGEYYIPYKLFPIF